MKVLKISVIPVHWSTVLPASQKVLENQVEKNVIIKIKEFLMLLNKSTEQWTLLSFRNIFPYNYIHSLYFLSTDTAHHTLVFTDVLNRYYCASDTSRVCYVRQSGYVGSVWHSFLSFLGNHGFHCNHKNTSTFTNGLVCLLLFIRMFYFRSS